MPARIERKVLQSGASKCTALPPDWLRMFNLQVGDNVDVIYNSIVIVKAKDFKIDPEFLKKEFQLILDLEKESEKRKESQEAKE